MVELKNLYMKIVYLKILFFGLKNTFQTISKTGYDQVLEDLFV